MARASASGSASSKRLPPADLARYMVMSALRSTSAGLRSPAGPSTMPMLPRTVSSRPSMRTGREQRVHDARGEVVDLALGVGAGGQRHELVAAEPGDHLAGRGRAGLQPVGDLDQQPVAGRVAEAVVDGLEAVEVEVAQAEALARRRARERLLQAFEEQRAVGQSGERVVRGLVAQPQVEQPALGGVLHQRELVLRAAVGVAQQGDRQVGPQHRAVGAVERLLDVVVLALAADQLVVEPSRPGARPRGGPTPGPCGRARAARRPPNIRSSAPLTSRTLPSRSAMPMPMAAPSNTARNRASLACSACATTPCARQRGAGDGLLLGQRPLAQRLREAGGHGVLEPGGSGPAGPRRSPSPPQ